MEDNELNLNEMEEVSGGKGGYKRKINPTKYCDVYHIQPGDNLTRIAKRYNTTVEHLLKLNPTITNKNDITAGYYLYVPKT